MPGTITFKPIEANLTHNTDIVGKMNPYCAFIVGDSIFRGQVCKHGGKHPIWNDAVTIPFSNQSQVIVEVMDKDRFSRDDNIGSFMINLNELQAGGQSSRWYPLTYKNKPAGEILLETSFSGMNLGGQTGYTTGTGLATGMTTGAATGYGSQDPFTQHTGRFSYINELPHEQRTLYSNEYSRLRGTGLGDDQIYSNFEQRGWGHSHGSHTPFTQHTGRFSYINELPHEQRTLYSNEYSRLRGTGLGDDQIYSNFEQRGWGSQVVRQEIIEKPIVVEEVIVEQVQVPVHERRVFTEQQQVVEPRTFMREVDVVETRAHLQNIEVLEPTRVMKEVQYTQAVPVTKTIEINEPHVVRKEVEVIEPRLVTKTIQVVENVPVMKQVEVIENVTRLQEVQTFEPQTFTKQVEVTDYVPVTKQVTVTEPVHLKKAVEFVEPVITTKTITKQMQEAVIVDESYTTTVGPASVIGESRVYGEQQIWGERFSYFTELPVETRTLYTTEYSRLRGTGLNDDQIYQNFEQRGWGRNSHHHHHSHHHSGRFSYINQLPTEQRTLYTNEYSRLRGTGLNDDQIYSNFEQRGWGGQSHGLTGHGSHNPFTQHTGRFSYINELPHEQRTLYSNEYSRLRGTGLGDDQIYSNFEQRGWGHKSLNPLNKNY